MLIIETNERSELSDLFFIPQTTRYDKKMKKTLHSLGVKHSKCEWSWFKRFTSKDEPYVIGEVFVDHFAKKYVLKECSDENI